MAHALLDAYLVSEACSKALSKHSLVDSNTAARKTVERLHALSLAADSTPDSKGISLSDDEFILIASYWSAHRQVQHPHPAFGQVAQLRSYG